MGPLDLRLEQGQAEPEGCMKNYFAEELSGRTLVVLTSECNTFISRERQRADAAERELAALREELASQKAHYVEQLRGAKCADKLQVDLSSAMSDIDDIVDHNADLQQRLTAAEQRNADVEKRAADLIECLWGIELPGAGNPRLRKLRRALEALKPTESGASE